MNMRMPTLLFDKCNLDIYGEPGVPDFTPTERMKLTRVFKNISIATSRFHEASQSIFEEDDYAMEQVETWFGVRPSQNSREEKKNTNILSKVVSKGARVHHIATSPKQIITFINQRAEKWPHAQMSPLGKGSIDAQNEQRIKVERLGRYEDAIVKKTFSGHGILVKNDPIHTTNDDNTYYLILENLVTSILDTDDGAHLKPKFLARADPALALDNTKSWVSFFLAFLKDGALTRLSNYQDRVIW